MPQMSLSYPNSSTGAKTIFSGIAAMQFRILTDRQRDRNDCRKAGPLVVLRAWRQAGWDDSLPMRTDRAYRSHH